jgi:Domain of unknown function (DUF4407)
MVGDFFIWCAGSDTNVLSKCEDSVRIKHIGLGTLVLIPAVMGFISMSYALSTIDILRSNPYFYLTGGLIWGLIIFAFDRFIVSTHKKQQNNIDEFKNITFYLRLIFAFVLGIVISHPFVLLYFDGSITENIIKERDNFIKIEETRYQKAYDTLTIRIDSLIRDKRCNERLLTAEQSGIRIVLPCGTSSGIPNINGTFPRTREIKNIITGLEREIQNEQTRINSRNDVLTRLKDSTQKNILRSASFDYLKRELTLEKLKKNNPIIGTTELLLMLAFMLVDILPLIFKTFSSFSMYDKILVDDSNILRDININSRKSTLQKAYDKISRSYEVTKDLDGSFDYKKYIEGITQKYNISRNISIGLSLGFMIAIYLYLVGDINITDNQLLTIATFWSIIISVFSNFVTDFVKWIAKLFLKK